MKSEFQHQPVLLKEAIDYLNINPSGIYVDGTVGGAGHSREIARRLDDSGMLIGIDQDQTAIDAAYERLQNFQPAIRLFHRNFAYLRDILAEIGVPAIDGILLDLGVSSPQLDEEERGLTLNMILL